MSDFDLVFKVTSLSRSLSSKNCKISLFLACLLKQLVFSIKLALIHPLETIKSFRTLTLYEGLDGGGVGGGSGIHYSLKFIELCPLIDVKKSFPLSILSFFDQFSSNFV